MPGSAPSAPILAGARAVVTGSSSGIGRAILVELARAGASVVAHANRSFPEAEKAAAELKASGVASRATAIRADLKDVSACKGFVDASFAALGGADIWVNNAGADILTGGKQGLSFEEKLEELLRIDVRATMLLSREAGRRMREASGGCIINIGWDQAQSGMEGDAAELFAAAKGAVMSFTKCIALSLAPKVRVNCIAPGWIRTKWGEGASGAWQERVLRETPLGRWGAPEDVARMARFLASRDSEYITGQVISVNGGAVR